MTQEENSCCTACAIGAEDLTKSFNPESFDGFVNVVEIPDLIWKTRKNYRPVRKVKMQGLDLSIEQDKGMTRSWKDNNTGEEGSTKFKYPYGYICRTDSADDEQLDFFLGPDENSEQVFIIHQMKKPKSTNAKHWNQFDEFKVMLGFSSIREAKAAYLMHYNDERFLGSMSEMAMSEFKDKVIGQDPKVLMQDLEAAVKSLGTTDLEKGMLDKLSALWQKVKNVFKNEEVSSKPKKKWIRTTPHKKCTTNICKKLDGMEISIDESFPYAEALLGYELFSPPAHGDCNCRLEINTYDVANKAIKQQQVLADPYDVDTLEGVTSLLSRFGGMKDQELLQLGAKIWGEGVYENRPKQQAKAEILGFLLDQRDRFELMKEHGLQLPQPLMTEVSDQSMPLPYSNTSSQTQEPPEVI